MFGAPPEHCRDRQLIGYLSQTDGLCDARIPATDSKPLALGLPFALWLDTPIGARIVLLDALVYVVAQLPRLRPIINELIVARVISNVRENDMTRKRGRK